MIVDPCPIRDSPDGDGAGGPVQTTRPADESTRPASRLAGKVALPRIRVAAVAGLLATAALLGLVSATAGLGVAGWIVGLATGSSATVLLVMARRRSDQPAIHPADWVTLTRMLLIAGVAGLVADSFSRTVSIAALVSLAAVALALDAVDGLVARRTGTATPLGGRLDGEVDAFLILLLSIVVARDYGPWVLIIGAARYAFLLAGLAIPWLAAPLPPRYWRKVVAAVQGIVLTVAASGVPARATGMIAVAVALLLLIESFGRDVIWLYRAGAGARTRQVLRVAITVLSVVIVWVDLIAPNQAWRFTPAVLVRIPVEALVLVAVALVLPPRPRRIVAGVAGVLFGVLTVAKILDIAFYEEIDRAFNPVRDWVSIPPALGVVQDAVGATFANVVLGALVFGLVVLIVIVTACTIRITTVAARHRRGAVRGLVALAAVWGVCAGLSLQFVPGNPVASTSAVGLADEQVRATASGLTDPRVFEQATRSPDPQAAVPASDVLTGLRGKDVVIAFVESYGQVAVQNSSMSPGVDAVLRQGTASLARSGWSAQSAWLTSPTFGGISWLAHSTLESGLWINTNQRYNELIDSRRYTLSDAFKKAGWHTVADDPSDGPSWPPGKTFYHYDQLFNSKNVGYQGPTFAYAQMPDQYVLSAFQRNELAPGHKPVMAEIDLVSSHTPWAPLPTLVPWNKVGNGSVFDPQPGESQYASTVWRNPATIRKWYAKSIKYTLRALIQWVTESHDPNLVLIVLGDHQPHTTVSGVGATHEVPISIISRDPSVFKQMASWHWQDGLMPGRSAPLKPMSAFRNQLLGAFSTAPAQTASADKPASRRP
jgi:phosphatidylglycerophosphate synthase